MAMAAGELFTRGTEEEEEPGAFPSGMAFWRRHLVEDDMQFSHFYGVGGLKSGATLTRTRRSPPASSRRSAPAPVGTSSTVEPMMINHLELMHTTYQSFNGEIEQGICCKLLWPCGVLPEISGIPQAFTSCRLQLEEIGDAANLK
nr:uncharacterized protein LOC9271180 [Oryza sativa Japonica Group]